MFVALDGGLALLLGFQTATASSLLAAFTLVTAGVFHANLADPMQQIYFIKNVAIAASLLLVAQYLYVQELHPTPQTGAMP